MPAFVVHTFLAPLYKIFHNSLYFSSIDVIFVTDIMLRGLCCFLCSTLPVNQNLLYSLWTLNVMEFLTPGNRVSKSLRSWLAD